MPHTRQGIGLRILSIEKYSANIRANFEFTIWSSDAFGGWVARISFDF